MTYNPGVDPTAVVSGSNTGDQTSVSGNAGSATLAADSTKVAGTTPTAIGLAILAAADAAAERAALGLGTLATQSGTFSGTSSGTNTGDQVVGTAGALASDTDGTLAANSDLKIATQKATKTYVDNIVVGLLKLKGPTDCSVNPNFPAASKGDSYIVTVAGKIGGASGISVDVGDVYAASADNAGGTQAGVGASWFILEHNLVGALLAANNLSDLTNVGNARTALGLGTLATQSGTFSGTHSGTSSGTNTGDQTIGTAGALASDTDTTLAANSDLRIATQKAVKAYADAITAAQANSKISALEYVIDGGGSVITTGVKGDLEIPFACTINAVTLMADQAGSIVIDVWKDAYANFPPTVADTITASAKPTLSSADHSKDSTLTGWTTAVAAGDTIRFNVDSITTCQRVTISLKVTKT